MEATPAGVLAHPVPIRAIHPAMVRLLHPVVRVVQRAAPVDARVLAEVVAPALAVADVPAHVVVDVHPGVPAHVVAVVLLGVPLAVKVLVVRVAHPAALVNVPARVELVVHPAAPVSAVVVAPQVVLTDVRQRAPETVLMVATLFAVADASIHAVAHVNMFQQALHALVVQGRVAHIVIILVVWLAAPAACLVAYLHLNDLESDKRTRSRLAIRTSQEYNLHRDQRLPVSM